MAALARHLLQLVSIPGFAFNWAKSKVAARAAKACRNCGLVHCEKATTEVVRCTSIFRAPALPPLHIAGAQRAARDMRDDALHIICSAAAAAAGIYQPTNQPMHLTRSTREICVTFRFKIDFLVPY
jgi:hypothetical protein